MTVTWIGSPNYEKGRRNTKVDRIVIHWWGTAGSTLEGVGRYFQKTGGTSAHYSVSDSTIHQYVNTDDTAYHAGVFAMNLRSIGIEHDATTSKQLSELSYETSARLISMLAQKYNIPLDREHIIRHSEVKSTQCCGTIDVDKLISLAKGEVMQPDFKLEFLRLAKDVYGDSYNEGWNEGEKRVFVQKVFDKSIDYKKRAEAPALNPVDTTPTDLAGALTLAGNIAKIKGL